VYDVYELQTDEKAVTYSTAPNGIVGVSIILSGKAEIFIGKEWQRIPVVSVYGLIKKPDFIRISPNFREIAIGFKPYFLQLLLQQNMADVIQTKNLDARDVFKGIDALINKVYGAHSDVQILEAIEAFIAKQFNAQKIDLRLLEAMKLIYEDGLTNVAHIGEKINLSTTSVRNLFNKGMGRPPKELISILRMNKILKSRPNPAMSLTDLCYQHGYFDQAHFIHEFKEVLGMTPSQYFNNQSLAFDFYNSGRWQGDIFDPKNHLK
jgi:AraC-like DNA-binding protein